RILLALTNAFRLREEDFNATVEAAADIDELYSKTALAAKVDGIAPAIATDGRLEFRGARHPLLIPAVREILAGVDDRDHGLAAGPSVVTSTDLVVTPPPRALVISGPNTGGKTVALKAAGLLALMAQAGLLI